MMASQKRTPKTFVQQRNHWKYVQQRKSRQINFTHLNNANMLLVALQDYAPPPHSHKEHQHRKPKQGTCALGVKRGKKGIPHFFPSNVSQNPKKYSASRDKTDTKEYYLTHSNAPIIATPQEKERVGGGLPHGPPRLFLPILLTALFTPTRIPLAVCLQYKARNEQTFFSFLHGAEKLLLRYKFQSKYNTRKYEKAGRIPRTRDTRQFQIRSSCESKLFPEARNRATSLILWHTVLLARHPYTAYRNRCFRIYSSVATLRVAIR